MSSRLGPTCLTIGVILIGVAGVAMANSDRPDGRVARQISADFSTGFTVWALCGVLGLVIGLFALRRPRRLPSNESAASWESLAPLADDAATESASGRPGAALEPIQDSA